ncbi:MAG: hypothetical protein AAFX54_15050 [Pseudomonadota bacterium]
MRILIGLSIVQTLLLGLIGLRVLAIDATVDTVADTSLDVLAATSRTSQTPAASYAQGAHAGAYDKADIDAIRQVIREEVAALPTAARTAQARHDNADTPAPVVDAQFTAQLQRDVERFIARGGADDAAMADLQIKIARLPKEERARMLSRLTKAMNAGEIDSTF